MESDKSSGPTDYSGMERGGGETKTSVPPLSDDGYADMSPSGLFVDETEEKKVQPSADGGVDPYNSDDSAGGGSDGESKPKETSSPPARPYAPPQNPFAYMSAQAPTSTSLNLSGQQTAPQNANLVEVLQRYLAQNQSLPQLYQPVSQEQRGQSRQSDQQSGLRIPAMQGAMGGLSGVVQGAGVNRSPARGLTRIDGCDNCCFVADGRELSSEDLEIARYLNSFCAPYPERDASKTVEFRGMRFQLPDNSKWIEYVIFVVFDGKRANGPAVTEWRRSRVIPRRSVSQDKMVTGYPYLCSYKGRNSKGEEIYDYFTASVSMTNVYVIEKHNPERWAADPMGVRRCAIMSIVNHKWPERGLGAASKIQVPDLSTAHWDPIRQRLTFRVSLPAGMPVPQVGGRSFRSNFIFH